MLVDLFSDAVKSTIAGRLLQMVSWYFFFLFLSGIFSASLIRLSKAAEQAADPKRQFVALFAPCFASKKRLSC